MKYNLLKMPYFRLRTKNLELKSTKKTIKWNEKYLNTTTIKKRNNNKNR
ncbi:hypothetical protein ['Camptotheca acuminata' phytoplasma]